MRKNYKETRVEVEGHTFQIDFWDEHEFSIPLPYVRVSEIIMKPCWFCKVKMREIKYEIAKGWGAESRVEWAMAEITSYLQSEKDRIKELQQIETFCNTGEVIKWQD